MENEPRFFLSPAALTLLFPWFFSEKPLLGGYVSPCGGERAKHSSLAMAAIVATYLYLNEARLAALEIRREGLVLKTDSVYVHALSGSASRVSYLTRRLRGGVGGRGVRLRRLVAEPVKVYSPYRYILAKIYEHDLMGSPLVTPNGIDCGEAARFSGQAAWLRDMLARYRAYSPRLYKSVRREAAVALGSMKEEDVDVDDV